jgi:hypothetical protein
MSVYTCAWTTYNNAMNIIFKFCASPLVILCVSIPTFGDSLSDNLCRAPQNYFKKDGAPFSSDDLKSLVKQSKTSLLEGESVTSDESLRKQKYVGISSIENLNKITTYAALIFSDDNTDLLAALDLAQAICPKYLPLGSRKPLEACQLYGEAKRSPSAFVTSVKDRFQKLGKLKYARSVILSDECRKLHDYENKGSPRTHDVITYIKSSECVNVSDDALSLRHACEQSDYETLARLIVSPTAKVGVTNAPNPQ